MTGYIKEYHKESFTDKESLKAAYLKAAKWVSTYILTNKELKDTIVQYEKDENLIKVTVRLYVFVSENNIRENHCKICKESHSAFFMKEDCNCAWCKIDAYQRRTDDSIRIKREYYNELLNKSLKGDR